MKPMAFTISVVLLILAGCAPLTPAEYISSVSNVNRVVWKENYQTVYRKVVQEAEKCFEPGAIAGYKIDRDIFTDIGEGKVTVTLTSLGGRPFIVFSAVIKPTQLSNESLITVYSYYAKSGERIATWLESVSKRPTDCV